MKTHQVIASAVLASTLSAPLFAEPAYPGEWHKTRLFTWLNKSSQGVYTDTEFQFIEDNVGMSSTEKQYGWRALGVSGQEEASIISADRLHSDNPNHRSTMYRSGRTMYLTHRVDDRLINNTSSWVYDFDATSNTSKMNASSTNARNTWISQINARIDASNNDRMGMFMDSTRTTSSTGALDYNWGESMLRGIDGYTIANGLDPDGVAKILTGHLSLESTDSIWMEDFFRSRMTPDERDEQANVLIALSYLDDTKEVIFAASEQHNEFSSPFNTAFRAHLLVANESTHFSWFDYENGDDDTTFYNSVYGQNTGAPLAAANNNTSNDGLVFTRYYERATVSYNIGNGTSSVQFNQSQTSPGVTHLVYQGEGGNQTRVNTTITTNSTANGNQFANMNAGGIITFNNVNAVGGETIVSFRIKAPSGTRRNGVYVNGVKQAVISHNQNAWVAKNVRLVLLNGSNDIELRDSEGTAELDVDYMAFPRNPARYVGPQQAEDAVSVASTVKTDRVASRDQYEDGSNGMNLTWYATSTGINKNITFRVKSPSGTRSMGVYVNNAKYGTVTTSNGAWNNKSVPVSLSNGVNTIELRDSEGTTELDVDYMIIADHGSSEQVDVSPPIPENFVPNPNTEYWIDCSNAGSGNTPRLSTGGEDVEPYDQSTASQGSKTRWKFVPVGNGLYHIDRSAGGTLPRLRTDNSLYADMQATSSSGDWTQYEITPSETVEGAYYLTLPNAPSNYQRLQLTGGRFRFVSTASEGTQVSFFISEAN